MTSKVKNKLYHGVFQLIGCYHDMSSQLFSSSTCSISQMFPPLLLVSPNGQYSISTIQLPARYLRLSGFHALYSHLVKQVCRQPHPTFLQWHLWAQYLLAKVKPPMFGDNCLDLLLQRNEGRHRQTKPWRVACNYPSQIEYLTLVAKYMLNMIYYITSITHRILMGISPFWHPFIIILVQKLQ